MPPSLRLLCRLRRNRTALAAAALLAGLPLRLAATEPAPTPQIRADETAPLPDDWHKLLRLDADALHFFAARVPRTGSPGTQLDAIVAAILDRDGLGFTYREDGDFTAQQAFRRRQGNCVAFSFLVVAAAREYRLTARFNEVRIEPEWDRVGQLVAEVRHLNVVVRTDTGNVMVDLLPPPGPGVALTSTRQVSDAHAAAMLYSNAGVHLLGRGREEEALPLLRRATVIAPLYPVGWVNLGQAHSRRGETAAARACFEQALQTAPNDLAALAGLARICRDTGDTGRAAALERRTERHRERNPFYLAALARRDLAAGDATTAERRLRRALAIKGDEPEFYELAIAAAQQLGQTKEVARWSARLAALRKPGERKPAPEEPAGR